MTRPRIAPTTPPRISVKRFTPGLGRKTLEVKNPATAPKIIQKKISINLSILEVMKKVEVSVVIPAYNEEKNIGKSLKSLSQQETDKGFEVVVVDNNSTDGTAKVASGFTGKLNMRVIKELKKGRGAARARGYKEAKGDIIFSTDADTIVAKDWLENGLKYFNDRKVVGITGPWRVNDVAGFAKFFLNHFQEILSVYPAMLIFGHPWLTGFNLAVRRPAYEKCGGFDADLNAYEDIDLTMRLRKFGKIKYAWKMKVVTSGRRYKKGILHGLWDYQKLTIQHFFSKKMVYLEDDR